MNMALIWLHLIAGVLALGLGYTNLAQPKGTPRHRRNGWLWIGLMLLVTVPSFWIRELNDGDYSWIHVLTLWSLFCMIVAIVAIRMGRRGTHARFMVGSMAGITIAALFAFAPGRFISRLIGY